MKGLESKDKEIASLKAQVHGKDSLQGLSSKSAQLLIYVCNFEVCYDVWGYSVTAF